MATEAKERPIPFKAHEVIATLDGRQSQFRRVIKPQPCYEDGSIISADDWQPLVCFYHPTMIAKDGEEYPGDEVFGAADADIGRICPYGQPGDRLWVREGFAYADKLLKGYEMDDPCNVAYRAGGAIHEHGSTFNINEDKNWNLEHESLRWRPSIHMPRWASRLTLEITDVRVERVQGIAHDGCISEGCAGGFRDQGDASDYDFAKGAFQTLWNSINDKRGFGWDVNPWVWVVRFKILKDVR